MVKSTKLEKARAELIAAHKSDEKTIKELYRKARDPVAREALSLLFTIVVTSRHGVEGHGQEDHL